MRLKWNVDGNGELLSPHPYAVDSSGSPEYYRIVNAGDGEWELWIEDSGLASGSIEECIKAANQDATAARRRARAVELMREIYQLERQEGGNWRKLSAVNRKRQQLQKIQQGMR